MTFLQNIRHRIMHHPRQAGVFFVSCILMLSIGVQQYSSLGGMSIGITVVGSTSVINVTSSNPDDTYTDGDIIFITVTYNDVVDVSIVGANPTLKLNNGGIANYVLGSGTKSISFRYLVLAGQSTDDLGYSGTSPISLNGGTRMTDPQSADVNPTFPTPGQEFSLSYNKDIVIAASAASTAEVPETDTVNSGGGRGHRTVENAAKEEWMVAQGLLEEEVPIHTAPPVEEFVCPPNILYTTYQDITKEAWFTSSVEYLLCEGHLDMNQDAFRAGSGSLRAEIVKLLVSMHDPAQPTTHGAVFDDVPAGEWYSTAMLQAAEAGWIQGDNNCYGSASCSARPLDKVTRAEFTAMVLRSLDIHLEEDHIVEEEPDSFLGEILKDREIVEDPISFLGLTLKRKDIVASTSFIDVPTYAWYAPIISLATDRCILQGDDNTGLMRPDDEVNRAEMVTILDRAFFGLGCE